MGIFGGARNINVVSVSLGLLLIAAGYLGWKFVPPYWQAYKVDNALQSVKWEAAELQRPGSEKEGKLLVRLREEIVALGVDGRYLDVYFAPALEKVHAEYTTVVDHPFDKTTVLEFHRTLEIPREEL